MFGIDFAGKGHYAEAGRACCEFLLAKAIEKGIKIGISGSSSLLDTNLPEKEKLYGYHRLPNPPFFRVQNNTFKKYKYSEIKDQIKDQKDFSSALHKSLTFYYSWITLLFATHREIAGDLGGQPDWHSLSVSIPPEAE